MVATIHIMAQRYWKKKKKSQLMKKKKNRRRVKRGGEIASIKLRSELRTVKRQVVVKMEEICNSQWARYLGIDATSYMMSL